MNDHNCNENALLDRDRWVCECCGEDCGSAENDWPPTPTPEDQVIELRALYNKEWERTCRLEGLVDMITAFVEVQHNEKTAAWIRKKKEEAIKG